MLNRNTPMQGPMTEAQTDEAVRLLLALLRDTVPTTPDECHELMRAIHEDVLETVYVVCYDLCTITGLEDCNSRWCELHYMNAPLRLTAPGPHNCDAWVVEVGLATSCSYGCKVIKCAQCGAMTESHRAVYGCPNGQ